MKKKPAQKLPATPEYDSGRETRVLLEKIGSDVETIAGQVASNSGKLDRIEKDVTELKDEMAVVKVAVQHNTQDVKELKGDVKELKGDVKELKGDVKELKGDVKELKGDVKQINQKLDTVLPDHEQRLQKLEAIR